MSRAQAGRLTAAAWTMAADGQKRRCCCSSSASTRRLFSCFSSRCRLLRTAGDRRTCSRRPGPVALRAGSSRCSIRGANLAIAGAPHVHCDSVKPAPVALISLLATPSLPVLVLPASTAYGAGSALAWPALLSHARTAPVSLRATLTAAITVASGTGLAAAFLLGFVLPESLPFHIAIALSLLAAAAGLALSSNIPAGAPALQPVRQGRGILSAVLADRARLGLGAAFFFQSLALAAVLASFRAFGQDMMGVSLHHETLLLLPAGAASVSGSWLQDSLAVYRVASCWASRWGSAAPASWL